MKLIREIFLALLVTFFGAIFVFLASAFLYIVFEVIFSDAEGWAALYLSFFVVISFIPAFICYKLFRKYRVEE